MKQAGFFDVEERLARLSGLGDQLEAFSQTVNFEAFRPDLAKALSYADGSKGGRPPFDIAALMPIEHIFYDSDPCRLGNFYRMTIMN